MTLKKQLENGTITAEQFVLKRMLERLEKSKPTAYNTELRTRVENKLKELEV